jgi:hypothetical protein
MYLTHAEDWEYVGRVHGEFFGDIRPAATMVVVAATPQSQLARRNRIRRRRSGDQFVNCPILRT